MFLRRQTSIEQLPLTLQALSAGILNNTNAINILNGDEAGSIKKMESDTKAYIDGLKNNVDLSQVDLNTAAIALLNSPDGVDGTINNTFDPIWSEVDSNKEAEDVEIATLQSELGEIASINGKMTIGHAVIDSNLSTVNAFQYVTHTHDGAYTVSDSTSAPDVILMSGGAEISNGDIVITAYCSVCGDDTYTDYKYQDSRVPHIYGSAPVGLKFVDDHYEYATDNVRVEMPVDIQDKSFADAVAGETILTKTKSDAEEFVYQDNSTIFSGVVCNMYDGRSRQIEAGSYLVLKKIDDTHATILGWNGTRHSSKSVVTKFNALLGDADSFHDTLSELANLNDTNTSDVQDLMDTVHQDAAELAAATDAQLDDIKNAISAISDGLTNTSLVSGDATLASKFGTDLPAQFDETYLSLDTVITPGVAEAMRASAGLFSQADLSAQVELDRPKYHKLEIAVADGEVDLGVTDVGVPKLFTLRVEYGDASYDTLPIIAGSALGKFSVATDVPDGTTVTARFVTYQTL